MQTKCKMQSSESTSCILHFELLNVGILSASRQNISTRITTMTTNHLPHPRRWLYALGGLIVGAVSTALIAHFLLYPRQMGWYPQTRMNPMARPGISSFRGDADRHFIVMMIPHHEGAIAMADLALSRTKRPEIKTLAESIKKTQTQEIQQMRSLYQKWYGTEVPNEVPGMGMGMGMGMHRRWSDEGQKPWMATDLATLEAASDFDREFLVQMIPHHQMAIMMSTMVVNSARNQEIRDLAQSMIDGQSAEIQQMQEWYQVWYPQS
jgi:uncharacterized protein (DUF305 family)